MFYQEWQNLKVRFTYPEKYWKLANYYYSHKKVWISGKNVAKLENLINQKEIWEKFIQNCFQKYFLNAHTELAECGEKP